MFRSVVVMVPLIVRLPPTVKFPTIDASPVTVRLARVARPPILMLVAVRSLLMVSEFRIVLLELMFEAVGL